MNGETFLIYTTQEGGRFNTLLDADGEIRRCSEEEYRDIRESRELDVTPTCQDTGPRKIVRPVLILLARIEENHDFVLGSSREEACAVTG